MWPLATARVGAAAALLGLAVAATPATANRVLSLEPTSFTEFNHAIVLLNGFLVFFMQVGFVALETGSGRAKNVRNILLKNTVDLMLCGLCWWSVGWAFAYGDSAGGIIGRSGFFFNNQLTSHPWFFSFTFCLTCITIVSGCLAERTQLIVYPVYTVIICSFLHPLVVHWTWHADGWLQHVNRCIFLDFAGGTVVHLIGGFVGLVGATLCGPRMGRFEEGMVKDMQPHDMVFVSLGTFMLWFGWYGFNCGSAYLYNGGVAASTRAALCTTLSASSSGLSALLLASQKTGTFDVRHCCNGLLAGLVAATSCAGFIEPWAATVIGFITGPLYVINSRLLLRLQIDDPLDSSTVHFASGVVGTLAVALFAKPEHTMAMASSECAGIVYNSSGWTQLGTQVLGLVAVLGVTGAAALTIFKLLDRLGLLRVDQATELAGIDNMEHGGPAYPEFTVQPASIGANNGYHR